MPKCPYCDKEVKLDDCVLINMESYQKTVKVRSSCCGKILHCQPYTRFHAYRVEPQPKEDDWGS
jgi:hypothetical protein